jgi:hypothetical protein
MSFYKLSRKKFHFDQKKQTLLQELKRKIKNKSAIDLKGARTVDQKKKKNSSAGWF